MKIELLRFSSQEDSTSGLLLKVNEDGTRDFLCYTVEDEYRLKKIKGETRIKGNHTYKVALRDAGSMTKRYKDRYDAQYGAGWFKGMLWIQDTIGYSGEPFSFVYFHAGNSDDSSMGCVITGDSQENNVLKKDGWVSKSRQSFERIYPTLSNAVLTEGLELEIIDYDYPASDKESEAIDYAEDVKTVNKTKLNEKGIMKKLNTLTKKLNKNKYNIH